MKILRAIVAGERDGRRLAEFRDARVQASQATIAKSLEGTLAAGAVGDLATAAGGLGIMCGNRSRPAMWI